MKSVFHNSKKRFALPVVASRRNLLSTTSVTLGLMVPLLASGAQAQQRPAGFLPDDFSINQVDPNSYGTGTGSNVYFVSPTGSSIDGQGRTTAQPWSLTKALEDAPTGSVLKLRGGEYRLPPKAGGPGLSVARPMTIQAYGSEEPWIKGSTVVTSWTKDGTNNRWYTDSTPSANVTFEYPPTEVPQALKDYPQALDREQVYMTPSGGKSKPLVQVGGVGSLGTGKFYVDRNADRVYIADNPLNQKIEVTSAESGIGAWRANGGLSGTKIRGLGFMHFAERAVEVGATGVEVEDCTIVWNAKIGLYANGQSDLSGTNLHNNIVSCNGEMGVFGVNPMGLVIQDNLIQRNNVEDTNGNYSAAGAKFVGPEGGLLFRHNTVIDNYGQGIWLDEGCDNSTVVGNTCRNNPGPGIMFEISRGATIAFNFLDGDPILIQNATNAQIYNNTIINFSQAVIVKKYTRTNTNDHPTAGVAIGGTYPVSGVEIKNNLFAYGKSTGFMIDTASNDDATKGDVMVAASNHNGYFRPGGNPTNIVRWRKAAGSTGIALYKTVADFRGDYPQYEANAVESSANPFTSSSDYHPAAVAVGKGTTVPDAVLQNAVTPDGEAVDMTPIHLGAFNATNAAPTVTLTAPANNQNVIGAPATIEVTASASDPDGNATITRVEFFVDGSTSPIASDTSAPYEFSWTNVAAGNHTVAVKAIDNAGAASPLDSAAITVKARVRAINAGESTTTYGSFLTDRGYSSGSTFSTTATVSTTGVSNPAPVQVYQSERYREGDFSYTVSGLTASTAYTVRLHFAETLSNIAVGQRVFGISVTGAPAVNSFDIRAAAGGLNKAVVREFNAVSNASGTILISFLKDSNSQNPKINGIEIVK